MASSIKEDKAEDEPVFLYNVLVTIYVGQDPNEQLFELHKGLICNVSSALKAAYSGNFTKAEGSMKLPEQDHATSGTLLTGFTLAV
ncbi:hypothetical protein MMC21_003408 [Puttea exsequens]|nr:hypothetical protein [Puttea exsequens]